MTDKQPTEQPSATISQFTFNDGTSIQVGPSDVVLLVGPNNAGKSATLRAVKEKISSAAAESIVLRSITLKRRGTASDLLAWIKGWAKQVPNTHDNPGFEARGFSTNQKHILRSWEREDGSIDALTNWLCHFISTEERLHICNPPGQISLTQNSPSHPIHYLQRDSALEKGISSKFKKAFGVDLIVHRNAGSNVPLYVGDRPVPKDGEDRVDIDYIRRLEELPQLQTQGDGMRSFAGVLLAMSIGRESILLIDEPEAFLHPPQAKLLGAFIMEKKESDRQIFIATHSTDIIKGILGESSPNVKVVRIRRLGSENRAHLLDSARIQKLWSDPLLRYSNILDGLFHEGVIVCEADSDCRFFAAVLEAAHTLVYPDDKIPDLMFTHCGGKARLPVVIRSLREVDVPVHAVADFDVLSAEQPLRDIVEALGATWADIEPDWKIVKSAVDTKRPDLNTEDVKKELDRILSSITSIVLPERSREELQGLLRRSTAWSNAKQVGKSFVPSGGPTQACERLLSSLRSVGLYVVEVGELEGFVRSESGHGPKWVNSVLTRNLSSDVELEGARNFALSVIADWKPKKI